MEDRLLNATEVAMIAGCSVPMLNMWYKWRDLHPDNEIAKILPDYERVGSKTRGKRVWKYSEVHRVAEFRKHVPKGRGGFMAEVTQKYRPYRKEMKNADAR